MGWKELGKERAGECPRPSLYLMLQVELEGGGHRAQMFSAYSPSLCLQGWETGNRAKKET